MSVVGMAYEGGVCYLGEGSLCMYVCMYVCMYE